MSDECGEIVKVEGKAHLTAIHNGKDGFGTMLVEHLAFQHLGRGNHFVFEFLILGNALDEVKQQCCIFTLGFSYLHNYNSVLKKYPLCYRGGTI